MRTDRRLWCSAVAALALLLGGASEAKVRIAATVSDLGALAQEVGGDLVQVDVLARPTQDPHFVDAKPSLVVTLNRANLLLLMGMELEIGWLPAVLTGSRNSEIQVGAPGYLDCSTLIHPLDVPTQKLDRSMGDIHPGGNPHYTLDPRNGVLVARGIAARLAELDAAHADVYRANAERFAKAAEERIAGWEKGFTATRGTPVVTYHKSWIYFVQWAGLDEVAFVEPKPGLPPNAAHVAAVRQVIVNRKVPLILAEEWYPADTSRLLSETSQAHLVRVPGMTPDGQKYLDHIGDLVSQVQKALGPKS